MSLNRLFKTQYNPMRAGFSSPAVVFCVCVLAASGETLILRNGTTVSGTVVKMDAEEIRIERCGRVEKYARSDVKSVNMDAPPETSPCAPAPARLEIPEGTRIVVRVRGFIDTSREPPGQVFSGEITESVVVDSQLLVKTGGRVIFRLIPAPKLPQLALDIIGIQLPEHWASVEPVSGTLSTRMTLVDSRDVRKQPLPEGSDVIQTSGERLLIPGNTVLTFAAKQRLWLRAENKSAGAARRWRDF